MGLDTFRLDETFLRQYWQLLVFLLAFAAQWGATNVRLNTVEGDITSLKKLEDIRSDVAVIQTDVNWIKKSQKVTEEQLNKLLERL